ncbi:hypothetical protein FGO68_gene15221 [Halteria grandinella]|uniref:Ankyrin repeat domain-containing protein n=1 Tax=Halteria grandinella TaxID=5974 RepID=A0A8J8P435_HALGN|nr:hypothetical protein FGO68_gene15221 [Halteria grandinella]
MKRTTDQAPQPLRLQSVQSEELQSVNQNFYSSENKNQSGAEEEEDLTAAIKPFDTPFRASGNTSPTKQQAQNVKNSDDVVEEINLKSGLQPIQYQIIEAIAYEEADQLRKYLQLEDAQPGQEEDDEENEDDDDEEQEAKVKQVTPNQRQRSEIDVNWAYDEDGKTPLMLASQIGNIEGIRILSELKGLNIDMTDRKYRVNAYWIAAYNGQTEAMNLLKNLGINILSKNKNGSNALHVAAKKQDYSVLQYLIDSKYPLNETKNNGVTALIIASMKNDMKAITMLCEAGADLEKQSNRGITPLAMAIHMKSMEALMYLIDKGAQVKIQSDMGNDKTPLFMSIHFGNLEAFKFFYERIGSKVDLEQYKTRNGFTTIAYAAYMKQPDIVNYLSLRFKSLDSIDPLGFTLLSRCVLSSHFETADRLISRGASLNFKNKEGKTALTLAVIEDNMSAIEFLLKKGADPHLEDNKGNDSCDYAVGSPLYKAFKEFQSCPRALPEYYKPMPAIQQRPPVIQQVGRLLKDPSQRESLDEAVEMRSESHNKSIMQQVAPGTVLSEKSEPDEYQLRKGSKPLNWQKKTSTHQQYLTPQKQSVKELVKSHRPIQPTQLRGVAKTQLQSIVKTVRKEPYPRDFFPYENQSQYKMKSHLSSQVDMSRMITPMQQQQPSRNYQQYLSPIVGYEIGRASSTNRLQLENPMLSRDKIYNQFEDIDRNISMAKQKLDTYFGEPPQDRSLKDVRKEALVSGLEIGKRIEENLKKLMFNLSTSLSKHEAYTQTTREDQGQQMSYMSPMLNKLALREPNLYDKYKSTYQLPPIARMIKEQQYQSSNRNPYKTQERNHQYESQEEDIDDARIKERWQRQKNGTNIHSQVRELEQKDKNLKFLDNWLLHPSLLQSEEDM